ncbi:MAG: hypothetical protein IV090_24575 [Candidatus Sericytochromatia bacterium]|nr:hypothetical protein [Candidatus Sericytochromatia bacterium]
MIYKGHLIDIGQTEIPQATQPDIALAGLLNMIPVSLYHQVPELLGKCLEQEVPDLFDIGQVAQLCALTYNTQCIGAVSQIRKAEAPKQGKGLKGDLAEMAQTWRRLFQAEAALRDAITDRDLYDLFVEICIAYATHKTCVGRVAYLVGLETGKGIL